MGRKHWLKILFLILSLSAGKFVSLAQSDAGKDPIEHLWYNEEQTAKIQVYKTPEGKFYGKIVWLKVPLMDGKPKVDGHNPKDEHKKDPLLGLLILKDFKKEGANTYVDGTIYDPKNGKTYSCKINHKDKTLEVRGFVGFSVFGRTTYWTLAE